VPNLATPSADSLLDKLLAQHAGQFPARPKPTQEHVVIVHGTFANPTYDAYPSSSYWWSTNGSFAKALEAALERHGSAARCTPPMEQLLTLRRDRPVWCGWSGGNAEVERRQGAYDLARHLRALQSDDTVRSIHIVAHSHGGNVVRRAMRYMNDPTRKLGRVITLGTPFLHFNDRAAWRRWVSRVHWPMLMVVAAIGTGLGLGAEWFNRSDNQFLLYIVVGILGAALYSMWRFARSSEASSVDVPAIALQFEHDEAIQLLRACAAFTAAPHVLLRDLLGGTVPPRPRAERPYSAMRPDGWYDHVAAAFGAVARAASNGFAWLSDLWNRPICAGAERVTSLAYRTPLLGALAGSACTLLLIMAFRPYRPALRPFLTSRLPRLRALFFHSMEETTQKWVDESEKKRDGPLVPPYRLPGAAFEDAGIASSKTGSLVDKLTDAFKSTPLHPDQMQGMAALAPVLVYWLLFYPIDKLVGLAPWVGAVAKRFVILVGARAAAGGAAGIDMLGAAFDPRRTGEVPAGLRKVTIPAAIEQDLEQHLDAAMRVNLAPLRHALDPARNAMLLDAVKIAFTEPALLHAQYYQDRRTVDYVAQCIAGTMAPAWSDPEAAQAAAADGSAAGALRPPEPGP